MVVRPWPINSRLTSTIASFFRRCLVSNRRPSRGFSVPIPRTTIDPFVAFPRCNAFVRLSVPVSRIGTTYRPRSRDTFDPRVNIARQLAAIPCVKNSAAWIDVVIAVNRVQSAIYRRRLFVRSRSRRGEKFEQQRLTIRDRCEERETSRGKPGDKWRTRSRAGSVESSPLLRRRIPRRSSIGTYRFLIGSTRDLMGNRKWSRGGSRFCPVRTFSLCEIYERTAS